MPWAEQAIFTSVRSSRLDGYQLAATSAGISREQAHELSQWGPAHDSLFDPPLASPSIAWFHLTDGQSCLGITQATPGEYSGRQGPRVYTQFVLPPQELVAQLDNPAWEIFHALWLTGRCTPLDSVPSRLPRCPVHGQAGRPTSAPSGETSLNARLLATQKDDSIALVCAEDGNAQLEAAWWNLPAELRRTSSFCTGLRYSSRRHFRVQAVPRDEGLLRQLAREPGVEVLDLLSKRAA